MTAVIIKVLKNLLSLCSNTIEILQKRLSKMPEGYLVSSSTSKRILYYQYKDKRRVYLGNDKVELRRLLACKEYYKSYLMEFEKLQKVLLNALHKIEALSLKNKAVSKKNKSKRVLITPFRAIDAVGDIWKKTNAGYVNIDTHPYETKKGDWVRSKSELYIADILFTLGVPYIYEYRIKINGRYFEPDFYILNCVTGEKIIWEHLGLMGDPSYISRNSEKIMDYLSAGYMLGKNLIFTMESDDCRIRTSLIRKMVKDYCLGAVVNI